MSEIKVKTCPFCGTSLTNEKPSKLYVHEKTGCIMDLRAFEEEQLKAWNTRKPAERVLERLKEEVVSWDDQRGYMETAFEDAIDIVKEEMNL